MAAKVPILPDNPLRRSLRVLMACVSLSLVLLIAGIVRLSVVGNSAAATQPASNSGDTLGIMLCTFGALGAPAMLWVWWIVRRAARRAGAIVSGENRLAQWTCSPEEWERYLAVIVKRSKNFQRVLLLIFGFTALVALGTVIFVNITEKSSLGFGFEATEFGGMLGFIGLLFGIFWIAGVYLPARLLRHPTSRDVLIGSGGLISAGKFSSWEMMGASIQKVRYEPGDPGTLLFNWSQPGAGYGGAGPMETVVPVPKANDADARKVVEIFTSRFQHRA